MSDFATPKTVGDNGKVIYGTDDGLLAEFYIKPVLMEQWSEQAGRPIHEDRIFVRIVAPGNTKTTWDSQAKGINYLYDEQGVYQGYEVQEEAFGDGRNAAQESDPLRFPKAWARFTKTNEKAKQGYAIEEWGAIPRSFAQTLKAQNIHTVEALAGLSDTAAQNIMGGLKWRDKAKAALSEAELLSLASKEQERAEQYKAELDQLRNEIKALKAELTKKKVA